eukprot:768658-Hanusia_phi.AAC.3
MQLDNNDFYDGEVLDGLMDGRGRYTFADGCDAAVGAAALDKWTGMCTWGTGSEERSTAAGRSTGPTEMFTRGHG